MCKEDMISYDAVAQWHDLGIQLGFSTGKLNAIERSCQSRPVQDCCKDVVETWRKQQKGGADAIAERLIMAVENIGWVAYAEELKGEPSTSSIYLFAYCLFRNENNSCTG